MATRSHTRFSLLFGFCGLVGSLVPAIEIFGQEKSREPTTSVSASKSTARESGSSNSTVIRGRCSARNAKIEAALLEPMRFQFTQTPLFGIAGLISKQHGFPVMLDRKNLEDQGISKEYEVDVDLPEIPLGDGLELMLEAEQMGFYVKNGVLIITTRDFAQFAYETRIYDVRGFEMKNPETLADVVIHTTGSQTWQNVGGLGDLSFFKGSFVIKQTRQTHQQIETVLNQLLQDVVSSPNSPDWPAKNRGTTPQPVSPGGLGGGTAGMRGGGGGGFGGGGGGGFF